MIKHIQKLVSWLVDPQGLVHVSTVVVIVSWMLASVPINIEFLAPFEMALREFEYSDIVVSQLQPEQPRRIDTSIVLVNIGHKSRAEIATAIRKLHDAGAKCIGVDVVFSRHHDDADKDSLAEILRSTPNVICAEVLQDPLDDSFTSYGKRDRGLLETMSTVRYGAVNLPIHTSYRTVREWSPIYICNSDTVHAFAVEIYQAATKNRYLNSSLANDEVILFQRTQTHYKMELHDVIASESLAAEVQSKIVLLGYMGEHIGDSISYEDRFYTPQNRVYIGRSAPDMYGLEIHATILSMLLHRDHAIKLPGWIDAMMSFAASWSVLVIQRRIDRRNASLGETLTRLYQASLIVVVFVIFALLHIEHSIILPINLTIACCVLSLDIATVYDGTVSTMYRWISRQFRSMRLIRFRQMIRSRNREQKV